MRFTNSSLVARLLPLVALTALLGAASFFLGRLTRSPFPPDTTPEGAYLRIVVAVTEERVPDMFAYLETEAQWASFTIRDARKSSSDRVRASYPEGEEKQKLLDAYGAEAGAKDGPELFALIARRRGWIGRLRKDLSGVLRVETQGERATVLTARGTRYPFRRRDNGIWGLTMFTAELLAESERASRDRGAIEAAATDYDRARKR